GRPFAVGSLPNPPGNGWPVRRPFPDYPRGGIRNTPAPDGEKSLSCRRRGPPSGRSASVARRVLRKLRRAVPVECLLEENAQMFRQLSVAAPDEYQLRDVAQLDVRVLGDLPEHFPPLVGADMTQGDEHADRL